MKYLLLFLLLSSLNLLAVDESAPTPDEFAAPIICSVNQPPQSPEILSDQVSGFFSSLLNTQSWPARWQCGIWSPFHGWLYILSDILIAVSYFLIPVILLYYISKRKQQSSFQFVIGLFIAFILACGFTHLIDAAIFWWPAYRLNALVRFATAAVSMTTVFALVKVTPTIMQLRSPKELEQIVTEQTDELRTSNLLISAYQHALDVASIVAITDQYGKIQHVNENFCKISKYSKDELIGQDHRMINSGYHPKEYIKTLWATISAGKIWKGELKNRAKDGTTYWVDTTIVPFLDEQGKPYQYVAIRADITQRKELEALLHKANTLARIGGWELDLIKGSVYWSVITREIHETSEDFVPDLATGINFYKEGEGRELITKKVNEAIEQGKSWDVELQIITAKNNERWVRSIGEAEMINGKCVRIYGSFQDIDSRKRDEERLATYAHELEVSNKELEQFAYVASHDLQEPLRMVGSYMQLLEKKYKGKLDDDADQFIHFAVDGATRMKQLINDLLNYSRLNRESITESVNLNEVLKRVTENLDTIIKETNANIIIGELPTVEAHLTQMVQLFQNLIVNAIKFRRDGVDPIVDVKAVRKNGQWLFSIRDNGIGIEPQYAEKVFIIFGRLHNKSKYGGTGIGLAIAKKIAERHNGKIWFETELGKGTTFYITLT